MATTYRFTIHSLAALGLVLGASACSGLEKLDDGDGPAGGGIPPAVQLAFDETCGTPGCHDAATASGGLDLSAMNAPTIIGGMSSTSLPMVDPGNVNGSYLAVKMLEDPPEGTTRVGARMPSSGDFDNVNNLVILGWIATASPSDGGGSTTDTPTGGDEMSTGETILACGVSDVAPDADNPFDIGMDAGQIPPDVGDALTNNCGCHGVDQGDLLEGVPPYTTGRVPFTTIAELQAEYMNAAGVNEFGFDILLGRVETNTMPPSYYCNLGGGEVITEDDRQLLIDWLTEGAPDAPTWMQ